MKQISVRERRKGVSVCGASLRQLRIACGITQAELARRAGYSERLIRKAEAGGSLELETIADLATALSDYGQRIEVVDLCSSPEGLARKFVESYDEHERLMLDYCGHLLAEDFVFHCAGESDSQLSGEWFGLAGFQAWLDQLFARASRPQRKWLSVTYLTADTNVTARYSDQFVTADGLCHTLWVNLHFTISRGLIQRVENQCDTQVVHQLAALAD